MIDVGDPDIIVNDDGVLLEDRRVKKGEALCVVYDDPRITKIAADAFSKSKIESVVAPYVKEIGARAFMYCSNLSRIDFPALERMGSYAFEGAGSLEEWTAPASFREFGDGTLRDVGQDAFQDSGLQYLDLSSAVGLKSIPNQCCQDSRLEELKLPKGLKEIGGGAFSGCSLKKIELPSSIENIGPHAFAENDLEELDIPEGKELLYIIDGAFCRNEHLRKITLPKNTVHVGSGVFSSIDDNAIIKCDSPYIGSWDKEISSDYWNGDHIVITPSSPDPRELAERGKKAVSEAFFALRSLINEANGLPWHSNDLAEIEKVEPLPMRRVKDHWTDKIEYRMEVRVHLRPIPSMLDYLAMRKYGRSADLVGKAIQDRMDECADDVELRYYEKPSDGGKAKPTLAVEVALS